MSDDRPECTATRVPRVQSTLSKRVFLFVSIAFGWLAWQEPIGARVSMSSYSVFHLTFVAVTWAADDPFASWCLGVKGLIKSLWSPEAAKVRQNLQVETTKRATSGSNALLSVLLLKHAFEMCALMWQVQQLVQKASVALSCFSCFRTTFAVTRRLHSFRS